MIATRLLTSWCRLAAGVCDQAGSLTQKCCNHYVLDGGGISSQIPLVPVEYELRIMIVGDSISHGWEGSHTWRYRLWQWFVRENMRGVQFVGPYNGTNPPDAPHPPLPPKLDTESDNSHDTCLLSNTNGGYAKDITDDWSMNHFAVWGRQAAQDKTLIRSVAAQYSPDYVLVELGFNDLAWCKAGAQGTLANMKTLVDEARTAKPDIKFAIANAPQRSHIDDRDELPVITREYNVLLAGAIANWSTEESPVVLVDFESAYSCNPHSCPAGYDGLHPNALGEFQIADAFSQALHDAYDLGDRPLGVPSMVPDRPTPLPSNFQVTSAPSGIVITWEAVYGAYSYDVRTRLVGTDAWSESTVTSARYDITWVGDGWEYEAQVRTNNGDRKSAWSEIKSVVAHPKTAPGPQNIETLARDDGIYITWAEPDGLYNVTLYAVITLDTDGPGGFPQAIGHVGHEMAISCLKPGHRYAVALQTWTSDGGGIPAAGRAVIPGVETPPPPPANLAVVAADPTTVHLAWTGSNSAAGYQIWARSIEDRVAEFKSYGTTTEPSYDVAFMYPAAWNYEYCVSAFNGNDDSAKTKCVVPEKLEGTGMSAGLRLQPPSYVSGPLYALTRLYKRSRASFGS